MPLEINEMDPGHPDEWGDCGMVALKVFLGIPYTSSLRAATLLDAEQGRKGLWTKTLQRIAADHGHRLVKRVRFEWEEDYGLIVAPTHFAVLRNGLVLDRMTIWPWEAWCKAWKCEPGECVLLVERE